MKERPTSDEPENKTGWIAYYAYDSSGSGYAKPNYLFMPGQHDVDDLLPDIVQYHEPWCTYGSGGYITIHRGVTPPKEVVKKAWKRAMEDAQAASHFAGRLLAEAQKYGAE